MGYDGQYDALASRLRSDCCDVLIANDERYCPKCGWECHVHLEIEGVIRREYNDKGPMRRDLDQAVPSRTATGRELGYYAEGAALTPENTRQMLENALHPTGDNDGSRLTPSLARLILDQIRLGTIETQTFKQVEPASGMALSQTLVQVDEATGGRCHAHDDLFVPDNPFDDADVRVAQASSKVHIHMTARKDRLARALDGIDQAAETLATPIPIQIPIVDGMVQTAPPNQPIRKATKNERRAMRHAMARSLSKLHPAFENKGVAKQLAHSLIRKATK